MSYRIFLSPPSQNGFEKDALLESLESNWLAPVGPALNQFEDTLSQLHAQKQVLALNSGTAAIHLALKLLGVEKDDEVIVASHTHNATVNPIIYQGATPVFVDSETDTWNISPKYLEEAITDRLAKGKKIKAILIVHLYGNAANLPELIRISEKHNIQIIEDAAESLGATFKNQPLGTFGRFGVLSFNGNKIITTSGGGGLICPDVESYRKALFYATQARDEAVHFQHSEIGYNYRMSNVLASLGNAQLKTLKERVEKRRSIFKAYNEYFEVLNNQLGSTIISSTQELNDVYANRWLSTFTVEPTQGITSETWRLKLAGHGIESRPLWKPMHLQPVFKDYPFYGDQTSDHIFERGICLPSGNDLSKGQIDEITSIIASLYQK